MLGRAALQAGFRPATAMPVAVAQEAVRSGGVDFGVPDFGGVADFADEADAA